MAKPKKIEVDSFPVQFATFNGGLESVAIGAKIARDKITLDQADRLLCGRRITGRIVAMKAGESPDQLPLIEGEKLELVAAFDCKRLGVAPDEITFRLTFNRLDLNGHFETLAQFPKKIGTLEIESVGEIPEKDEKEDEALEE